MVYPRRGSSIDSSALLPSVSIVDTPLLDISSTEIRRRVQQGLDIGGMVPQAIEPMVRRLYLNFS